MAKAKRGKKKTDWAKVGRWSLRTASVLLLVALAIGLTFGVDRLRTHADGHLRLASASPRGATVSFVWPGIQGRSGETWLPEADQEELIRVAERKIGEDAPLSAAPLRRVAEALGRTGWFVGEPVVRRTGAGRLRVEGDWRIPAAVVRWDGQDRLVSGSGFPMPPVYLAGRSGRPVITGVFAGPVVIGSEAFQLEWRDPGVAVGLDLVALLRSSGLADQIGGVDVAGYLDGGPIEIVSSGGNRVVWGSPVDDWTPGEPSVEEKIDRLNALVDRTGSIDAGQPRVEIHRARVEIDRSVRSPVGGGD
jgi:hypothetical protein